MEPPPASLAVGMSVPVRARVRLGRLSPNDVVVQLYDGPIDPTGQISQGIPSPMVSQDGPGGDGVTMFTGTISCQTSGLHGYSIRILPAHPDLANALELALITWAS